MLDEQLQKYDGYEIVEKNDKYKYITTRNTPLNAIVVEKGEKICRCGGELVMLTYVFNDGHTISSKIPGKKCKKCGRNFFTIKTVNKREHFFSFVQYEDFEENMELPYNVDEEAALEKDRKRQVPPPISEVSMLEKAASNDMPTDEGAWWIMYQTAMSIFNLAVQRDPVNNGVLDEFWSEIARHDLDGGLIDYLFNASTEQNARPLPFDDLMEIINYCGGQLQNVFNAPRHNIVKVDKMVRPYRVRNTGTRTMDWLGKQPGRTIKEKLCGKNKMLTQVNEYSYDIKENQVAMMLYKQLMKRVNDRINNGIAMNGYGNDESLELKRMFKLKKVLRDSRIADAKPVNHTVANNALLGDKNYSIIWKAYLEMCKYDKNLSGRWDSALTMYVKAVYVSICAYITCLDSVQIIDVRVNLSNSSNQKFECIVDFDKEKPLYLSLVLDNREICMEFKEINKNGMNKRNRYQIAFDGDPVSELLEKRGFPIRIHIKSNTVSKKMKIWADLSGINDVVNWCMNKIKAYLEGGFTFEKSHENSVSGSCVYDVLTNGEYTTVKEELLENVNNVAVVYQSDETTTVYEGKKNSIYPGSKEFITISDAVGGKLRTEALMLSLENIWRQVIFSQDDYFIYTVPDALEEFSQKKVKQCVKAWFPRNFPVWRSVASLTEILQTEKDVFRPKDVFVSIDLAGEVANAGLLTIKEEKQIKGYVCNHFPPFPEQDSGKNITEFAFLKNYINKYTDKIHFKVDEKEIDYMVKSGIVCRVLKDRAAHNYTYVINDVVNVLRVEYDETIINECNSEWLDAFGKFWNELKYLLPKEHPVDFVNILGDVIMDFVPLDEVIAIIGTYKEFAGIYCSVNKHINQGAYIYLERIRKHQPTWTEYLPELSLEVIKDGNYAQLELVGDNVSFDVMGEDNEHIVKETLVLKANQKEYRFPLKKKDISSTSALIEAYVNDMSFPLDHDVKVKLCVKYKYGDDNSYVLTLRPENPNEKAFDEIVVVWENVSRENNYSNIWPPKTNLQPDENVRKEIIDTRKSLEKIEYSIERHLVNYVGHQDKSIPIKKTDKFLNQNIFKIRNIVLSELPEAKEFIEWFINSDLYNYLGQISGIFRLRDIPEKFFDDNNGKELSFFMGDCMQVMFSIGKYTPDAIQRFFVENYEDANEKARIKSMVDMLLKNGENSSAIKVLIHEVRNAKDEDAYSVRMDALVKELGKMCCFDSELIYGFYNVDAAFMNDMVRYILRGLKKMLSRCERLGEKYMENGKDRKRYLGYLEAILAILRLRDTERTNGFEILAVGSEEAKHLCNTIRQLDGYMKHPHSSIRFRLTIEKPKSLSKMSDLTYALDLYLNGDKRAASIEVVGVDDEVD